MTTCFFDTRYLVRLIAAWAVLFVLIFTQRLEAESVPQELFVSFRGVTEQESALNLIKDPEASTDPVVYPLVISPDGDSILSWDAYANAQPFTSTTIIFDFILRYPDETQRQQRLGYTPYPGELPYSSEAIKLMERATPQVSQLIKEFHQAYPDAKIKAVSVGIGGEVLLGVLRSLDFKLDRLVFYYPPLAAVKGSDFIDTLNQGGYQQDDGVSVIALGEDPTIPYLEKLKDENSDLFHLLVT